MKVGTRNNRLRKLSNSKWGTNASTIRPTALALCYSVAEYAAPVLGEIISCPETESRAKQCMQSRHRMPEANQCRRPVLAGWNCATRHPERCMCSSGKTKHETSEAHSLYDQNPAKRRLESRNCFLRSVKPADFPPKVIRCSAWLRRLQAIPHRATVNIDESLAK